MHRVWRVQAVPGQAGWLPARRHVNRKPQPLGDYSLLDCLGGPGLRLQTGLSLRRCTRHVASQAGAAGSAGGPHVPQPGQNRIALEISWGRKAKDDLSVLGVWRRAFAVICCYKESRPRAQPRCSRRHPPWDTGPKAPSELAARGTVAVRGKAAPADAIHNGTRD